MSNTARMLPLVTKAFHLIFMVTWYAGLFYLPRLYIYHAQAEDEQSRDRFQTMEVRLFSIMTIGAALTLIFGLATLFSGYYQATLATTWFKIKLALLAGLLWHHYLCWRWIARLRTLSQPVNTRWLRFFNEIPALYLIAIVLLAVLKPF